jgi:hypothetical protein
MHFGAVRALTGVSSSRATNVAYYGALRGFSGGELTRRVQVRLRQWGSNRSPQPRRCGIAGGC